MYCIQWDLTHLDFLQNNMQSTLEITLEDLLKKIPAIGDKMLKAADKLKDSLKYLLVPGVLFEEFGFKYYGPINGHDLPALMTVLENVKGINRPVLIHVETKKGKGAFAPFPFPISPCLFTLFERSKLT